MKIEEYAERDALGLAALVNSGQVTATEVLVAALEQIELRNPDVNAVTHLAVEEARAVAASGPSGAFAGVPMLIKDLGLTVRGWPRTSGSRWCQGVVDTDDDGLVARYRASGANLIGRSACSEFGIIGTTETALHGPTRNPWDLSRIAGGSSGGAAAAVAARMVPIAHASDGLGSIRIPAACCGLVGLKPTRDRVPNLPDDVDYAIGFVCDHVVTRTVRDSAAMLDETGHPETGSPYASPPKTGRYVEDLVTPPGRLIIHWSSTSTVGAPVHPEIEQALVSITSVLSQLGHEVRHEPLVIDEAALNLARLPVSAANFAAGMDAFVDLIGREPGRDDLEALTWEALSIARKVSGGMVLKGMQSLRRLTRQVLAQFEAIDVFMSPVMTSPAPLLGTIDALSQHPALANAAQFALYPYPLTFNFTGQPSISLPLCVSSSGLPLGLMFTARYADEATLIRLAAELERAIPWAARSPFR